MKPKDAYLACPVRGCSPEMRAKLDAYVAAYEATGRTMHYPHRDVDQNASGIVICEEHRRAMFRCKEFHLFWTQEFVPGMPASSNEVSRVSTGSFVDLGMAYAIRYVQPLAFYIANWDDALPQMHADSYLALVAQLEAQGGSAQYYSCCARLAKYCLNNACSTPDSEVVERARLSGLTIFDTLGLLAKSAGEVWAHRIPGVR